MNRRLLSLTVSLFLLLPTFLSYAAGVKPKPLTGSSQKPGQGDPALNERNSFSERGCADAGL